MVFGTCLNVCSTNMFKSQSVSFVPTAVISKRGSSFVSLESHYLEPRITNNISSTFL